MKRYTIFHAVIMSFFSKSLYRDVGRNWKGLCLGYLLLLVALVQVPIMVAFHRVISGFIDNEAGKLVEQIPEITISNGKVSLPEAQPYLIRNPETGAPVFIIDTTGEIASLDDPNIHGLLTETKLIIRQSPTETRIQDLSPIENFVINRERINFWMNMGRKWVPVATYPFAVIFSFLFRLVQILIYAIIGILFARVLNATADYQTLVRLAAVAITPVIILDACVALMGASVRLWWLIGFLITMGYLFYGIKANLELAPISTDST